MSIQVGSKTPIDRSSEGRIVFKVQWVYYITPKIHKRREVGLLYDAAPLALRRAAILLSSLSNPTTRGTPIGPSRGR